jgi:hypothetical protein
MSTEAPIRHQDNWFKDEDKTFRYYVTTGREIVLVETAEEAATSIRVAPLVEDIGNNVTIRFGNIVLTTSAAVQAGDTTVLVAALTGNIVKGAIGHRIQDVTGWTFEWILKDGPDTTAVLSVVPSITDAATGVVDTIVADTDTVLLVAKKYWYTFKRTNAGNETILAYGDAVLRGA